MKSLNDFIVGPVARLPVPVQTKLLTAFLAIVALLIALGADFGAKVAFVSITLDPEHDTPAVLKDYAQSWAAKPGGWMFLTGPTDTVRDVSRHYGVFFAKHEDGSVDHTQLTSLIDAKGAMRVQYLGARFDPEEFRHDLMNLVGEQ